MKYWKSFWWFAVQKVWMVKLTVKFYPFHLCFQSLPISFLILMAKEVYNESYQKTVEFDSVIFV